MTLLVIGESLIDVVEYPDGTVVEHPGGSPFNVARGTSRLGLATELVTQIGPDDRGAAPGQGQRQVPGAAAQIGRQVGRPGPEKLAGAPSPRPVGAQAQDPVEGVVSGGDGREHTPDLVRGGGAGNWLERADYA